MTDVPGYAVYVIEVVWRDRKDGDLRGSMRSRFGLYAPEARNLRKGLDGLAEDGVITYTMSEPFEPSGRVRNTLAQFWEAYRFLDPYQ
jgi:hypothetical protein